MVQGIIYYTDNRIRRSPIFKVVQETIKESGLPIVSCSLKPIDFGKNIVLENRKRSYPTMVEQIIICLENSTADYVFFCEHDVLYHKSHFDFKPERDDTYYYNINNWRWEWQTERAIHYDELTSLSAMCCNRELALDHYKRRKEAIEKWGWHKERSREPRWVRRIGYEPGTKRTARGGFSDEKCERRKSEYPNIDIRHRWTFSSPKTHLSEFKHLPTNWQEINIKNIPGWNLASLFQAEMKCS